MPFKLGSADTAEYCSKVGHKKSAGVRVQKIYRDLLDLMQTETT